MPHRRPRAPGTRHPRHRFPRTALWIGGLLAAVAVLWMVVAIPTLVKYPTDLDVRPRYEGTFTVLVNPATAAPLADPLELPLTVDRHIEAIPDESDSAHVLVRETITQRAGDLVNTIQRNDYVMDRSTIENVADSRAFAFEPANVVDRSGTYRLNLPFDTSPEREYQIYSNDTGHAYGMESDATNPTSDLEGLHLLNFTGTVTEAPVTDAYIAELSKATPAPLPRALTLEQLEPQLALSGIDLAGPLAALDQIVAPADRDTLGSFAREPIPITYVGSFDGSASIEPLTGAQVRVNVAEQIGARVDLTGLPDLKAVLTRYPDVPEATAAIAALDKLATGPAFRLIEYRYDQTPASVADIAEVTASLRAEVLLARVQLPLAIVAAALVSLAVGGIVFLRRRPRPIDMTGLSKPGPETAPAAEEIGLTSAGKGPR